jgi:hypothetical protein
MSANLNPNPLGSLSDLDSADSSLDLDTNAKRGVWILTPLRSERYVELSYEGGKLFNSNV